MTYLELATANELGQRARPLNGLVALSHVGERLGKVLAILFHDELGELCGVLVNERVDLEHHCGTLLDGVRAPLAVECGLGSRHGSVELIHTTVLEFRALIARRRVHYAQLWLVANHRGSVNVRSVYSHLVLGLWGVKPDQGVGGLVSKVRLQTSHAFTFWRLAGIEEKVIGME